MLANGIPIKAIEVETQSSDSGLETEFLARGSLIKKHWCF